MDEKAIREIPVEKVMQGVANYEQRLVRERMQDLSDLQGQYLKVRAMTPSDAKALHLMGSPREPGDERVCKCGEHKAGWRDMREQTLLAWKKRDLAFMEVYNLLTKDPLMFSSVWMQSLATKAVAAYDDLLDAKTKPAIRRMAASDVLESVDLKATPGVQGSGQAMYDPAFRMALERYNRGLELSDTHRRLLIEGGVEVEARQAADSGMERDLDGRDVPRGGDNSHLLPD